MSINVIANTMNEDDTKRSNSGKPIKNGGSNLENNLKLNPPSHLSVKFSTSDVDSESKHSSHQDNNNDDKFNSEKEIGSFLSALRQPEWVISEGSIPGCPPGLEYLTQVDQILVHQVVELLEAFTGWETKNRYVIKNSMGQQIFYAMEESDLCMRQCCGPARGFIIHITDNAGQEVMSVRRQFKCCAGCCWFAACRNCAYDVSIEAPPGHTIAYVTQNCSPWPPRYSVHAADQVVCKNALTNEGDNCGDDIPMKSLSENGNGAGVAGALVDSPSSSPNNAPEDATMGELQLYIQGPICVCQGAWCCDQDFSVLTRDGQTEIGKISKQFSGLIKEYFTDADNFGIQFPLDLEVKLKAALVGSVFLIDFMYFENESNNRNS